MALSKASKSILKVKSESRSDVFDSLQPMDGRPPGSSVHGILRQEHWSGFPFPPPGPFPSPGIAPASHVSYSGRCVLYH